VEYHVDFGRSSKTPPAEIELESQEPAQKICGRRHDFGPRFRYHTVERRHALSNALWQQKLEIKEKGYGRPRDAMLGIQGLRDHQQHEAELTRKIPGPRQKERAGETIDSSDAGSESTRVEAFFKALSEARRRNGEKNSGNLDSCKEIYHSQKPSSSHKNSSRRSRSISVEVEDGQVNLKAKPKT